MSDPTESATERDVIAATVERLTGTDIAYHHADAIIAALWRAGFRIVEKEWAAGVGGGENQ